MLDTGRYAEAERAATEWTQSIGGGEPSSLQGIEASNYLVEALIKVGKGGSPTSLTLAERVARTSETLAPAPVLATSLDNLAMLYTERGESARAVPLYERALTIRERASSATDPAIADTLDGLARALILVQRLQDADARIQRSKQIRQANGGLPLAKARTISLEALLHRYDGAYPLGLLRIDEALALQRNASPLHPDIASSLQLRGDLLILSGDATGAERTWKEALQTTHETLGNDHPLVPRLLRSLAIVEKRFGDLATAQESLEQAAALSQRVLAPCHQEVSAALDDLANLLEYNGSYARAQALFGQALAVRQRCLGPNHSLTATVVHNQGLLAAEMGDLIEAQRLQQTALRMWSAGLGPNHPYVARALDALAQVDAAKGDLATARTSYARSLAIRRKALGDSHPDVASTLAKLAGIDTTAGDLSRASKEIADALTIYEHGGVPQEPDHLASALEMRGAIERRQGLFDAARLTYSEALALRQRMFGTDHPLTAESNADIAIASFALGDTSTAFDTGLKAEGTGREHLRFTIRYLPERQAMAYAAMRPRGLDVALSIAAATSSLNPAPALDSVVRSRGVILDELATRAQATAAAADPQLATLNTSLIAARQRFATLMLRSLQGEDPVPPAMLDDARQQKEDAERALAERSAAAREEAARAQIGLDDVRRALPGGSALVSFVRYDRTVVVNRPTGRTLTTTPSYIALVARTDSPEVRVVPIGVATTIDKLVDAWHAEAGGRSIAAGATNADALRAYRAAGGALRARIWDPLADSLKDATRIFIVPDGALNLVSFASLPVGTRYLLETAPAIHYLSTERDLVRTDSASGHGLLALGGPAFDARPGATAAQRSAPCAAVGTLHFDDLPGSRAEIQDIAGIWGRQDVLTLTGAAATKTALTKAIAGRKVIHLATHGFFLGSPCEPASAPTAPRTRGIGGVVGQPATPVDNPLLLAGLALAGVNTLAPRNQQNGILNAEEIAGLNLQGTEWAVLSACDTGLGQITAGEGVFGLRRALQIAGVHTIVMSLWSVEDQSTRAWMRALYRARLSDHLDTPDSVRAAGLRLLADRRARGESTHPFYWAAFVAAGDWR